MSNFYITRSRCALRTRSNPGSGNAAEDQKKIREAARPPRARGTSDVCRMTGACGARSQHRAVEPQDAITIANTCSRPVSTVGVLVYLTGVRARRPAPSMVIGRHGNAVSADIAGNLVDRRHADCMLKAARRDGASG
jgi:hypothetical protein